MSTTRYDVVRFGAYALDQIRLTKQVILVPALRWSRLEIDDHAAASLPSRDKTNLWMRYRFPEGPLDRFMVTSGVAHVSDRFTGRDNTTIAHAYTRVDATASVELAGPRLTLGLAAQNLTNRRYVTSGAGHVLDAGPPRRIAVNLTSAF